MITAIREFFNRYMLVEEETEEQLQKRLQLATTALLVEMMRVDHHIDDTERSALFTVISERFDLDAQQAKELIMLANDELNTATDYHQFTSLINQGFNAEEKVQIAADNNIDRYEEHLVRKIAELLYVPHRDFIAAKLRVLGL